MRDLPEFVLPDAESNPTDTTDKTWKGFLFVFGIHTIGNVFAALIAPKTAILFPLFYLPFVQWLYVAPIMIICSRQGKKRMVKGALFAALLTAAPLALMMLLAFAGLALCAVIAGSMSHQ